MSCGGCHNEFPIHTKKKNIKKERKLNKRRSNDKSKTIWFQSSL